MKMLALKNPRARLAALTVLLTLALGLGGMLAWQAVDSARQQQRIARQTLNDYAEFASFVFANGVYWNAGFEVLNSFSALPPWNSPELFVPSSAPALCEPGAFYFEYEPATGAFRDNQALVPAAAVAALRDTLTNSVALMNEASWRFRLVLLDLGGAGNGVYLRSATFPGGFGIRGVNTCPWQDAAFASMVANTPALPPSLTSGVSLDSLYSVALTSPSGGWTNSTPHMYGEEFSGSAVVGPEFGDLELVVSLNPAIASDLVIGEIADSRAPSSIGLLILSALLLTAAVMQLRREYKLIAARSEFVSNVSHELRTPLSQILIFTELLKMGKLRSDEERNRSLGIIDKETRRLIRLVENILQFSSGESVPSPKASNLPLGKVVGDTIEAFAPLAESRASQLIAEIPDSIAVWADRSSVEQVLLNLLDNAVKYGPRGQTVRVEATARGGEIEISVEDQGPGIPPDDRSLIWEGFQRLERESNSDKAGSGIGLSVVKTLVERMAGRVSVADSSTGGARFVVLLPAAREGVS
jgi:signal transduction histidine kinase